MMTAEIRIQTGVTQTYAIDVEMPDGTPVDFTQDGWDVHVQIRARRDSTSVIHTWSLADGNVVLAPDGQNDRMLLRLDPSDTTAWTDTIGVWDLLLTLPDGRTARPAGGTVHIAHGVTKVSA